MKDIRSLLSFSVVAYLILLGFHGYGYGGNDQIEIIPTLKYWSNTDLFPHDFFITHFSERDFTERTPLLLFLHYTFGWSPWALLFWHFFFSMILISGLWKIATHISEDSFVAGLAVILTLTIGYHTSLGGNELYYNALIGSVISKGLSAWAIFFWLKHRLVTPYILLGVATYFQPLVSLQIMLILGIYHLWDLQSIKRFIPSALTFVLIGGPWILLLLANRESSIMTASDYLEIIEFRLAHHFMPQYFDWKHYVIFICIVFISWMYYANYKNRILSFIKITLGLLLVYSLSVVVFESTILINTQWFKTTIWIEFFGVIALLSFVKNVISLDTKTTTIQIGSFFLIVGVILSSWISRDKPKFDLPITDRSNHEIQLSEWAKQNTKMDDLFILPLSFSYFKNSAERSGFVDFKAMIHDESYMRDMYNRVREFYAVDVLSRRKGAMDDLDQVAPLSDTEILEKLRIEGVDYIVLPNSREMPDLVKSASFGNMKGWSVYQL